MTTSFTAAPLSSGAEPSAHLHQEAPRLRVASWSERVQRMAPAMLFASAQRAQLPVDYFETKSNESVLVGLGRSYVLTSRAEGPERFAAIAKAWNALAQGAIVAPAGGPVQPLILGGFSFDPTRAAPEIWSGFAPAEFTLPRVVYREVDGDAWVTYVTVTTTTQAADHELRVSRDLWHWLVGRIREQREREEDESRYEQRLGRQPTLQPLLDPPLSEDPDAERWQWLVAQAAGAVSGGGFEKVVLARSVSLPASAVVDAGVTLRRLTETAHEGFVFAFVRGQRCFLGATPERLVRQMDGLVEAGALAGSIARGCSDAEDEQLAAELLRDPKNLREHEIVVRAIVMSLRAAGVALDPVSDPAVVRTRAIQHLFTPIRGRSAQALSVLQLVERLHPTPATGGAPQLAALNWLRAHEGIDRGWYAAPVGWVDTSGNGEFAVALRSGVLAPQGATLFAGCGIVAGSNPERELAESTAKLVPMLEAVVRRVAR